MSKKVTAVFDIGKTNKKFFLFDEDFQEVFREYTRFDEIEDEDGFPTEDLKALLKWIKDTFERNLQKKEYDITAINFSTYGASFVHIDEKGKVLTPLYNYLKPIDEELLDSFYQIYGPELEISTKTGSPRSGMLNSGLQLYWLKYSRPEVFKKIRYSLHLPQYLSYIFTGIPLSEYTSIGCHTALWDYTKNDYHEWVYKEGIYKILPPIVSAEISINKKYDGKVIRTGVGIHDSSSALIPYIRSSEKPFILVSTGTWSVTMNPFSDSLLEEKDILNDSLNYMRINGKAVKSSKLQLGSEYKYQVDRLNKIFNTPSDHHLSVKFNSDIFHRLYSNFKRHFCWKYLSDPEMPQKTKITFTDFEEAYHQLMLELVKLQLKSIDNIADNNTKIKTVYVDGGFSDNDVFINLLSYFLSPSVLKSAGSSLGSALGAAIVISEKKLNPGFLRKNYALQKHLPFKN